MKEYPQYGNITQCYEESKRVLDFIEANPIIKKMADAAEEADRASTQGYYALVAETRLPWGLLLKWENRPMYLVYGEDDHWQVEEWEEGSSEADVEIGPLTVEGVLRAIGISAHEIAEEAAKK